MRPRFAARARGSPYSIREEIESSRARKSANLSAMVRAPLYRSSTAPVTRPANQYLMPRYIVSRFRKSIANACASAWQDRVPTIRFVFLPGPDPPSLSRSCRPIAAQRIVRLFFLFFLEEENWTYRHFPSLGRIVWRILWSLFENICFIYTICSNCSNLIEIMLCIDFPFGINPTNFIYKLRCELSPNYTCESYNGTKNIDRPLSNEVPFPS